MKFIKEEKEKRRDYIFKKDDKTKVGAKIIVLALIVLVGAVIVSGIDFQLS